MDWLFSTGGIPRGTLMEWIGESPASGAGTLSLCLARGIPTTQRPAVVIDPEGEVYPMPLWVMGGDPSAWIFLRGRRALDSLWSLEQALRCEAVSLVWSVVPHLTPVAFRRLQLAVESSGTIGFLVRPPTALGQPSWADVRLAVRPRPTKNESPRFRIRANSRRGQIRELCWDVELDASKGTLCKVDDSHEAQSMSLVS
ncbi:MAG: hypothetical protein KDA84_29875 [Planctomycetaceae bacterium]|nr:hypothetical protein [Planctomycetaceae bacterium]